ncbi:MAG: aminoglycoside phosphotransferase family protein [Clostridia bacterium]|nr:aminoglycoside phosphotransferase family protein [Clostridia bacterium]
MQEKLMEICTAFRLPGSFDRWEEVKVGNINKTYKVTYARENGLEKAYILQRVNPFVFKNPEQVMENIERVTQHFRRLQPGKVTLHYHHTRDGKNFVRDGDYIWRVVNYIPSAPVTDARDETLVRNAGFAFGEFQAVLSYFDPAQLYETIPDFHNTQKRFDALEEAVEADSLGRVKEAEAELSWLRSVREDACCLCRMQEEGLLPLRVTHNDTKVNNVLFDKKDHRALVVIDLDTVMPGLAGNDFGDAIRSVANTAAEDEKDLSKVSCDLRMFRAFAEGFLEPTAHAFTQHEMDTFSISCFALTVELAVRFLTDYLLGDPYFYCAYPAHNLVRARCQMALARDMQRKMGEMEKIIADCAEKYR